MSPFVRHSLIVAAAMLASLMAAAIWVAWATSREIVTGVTPLSSTGTTGRALLVYHPGLSDFPDRITAAFGAGMAAAGWRVDRTTASAQAQADLAGYDLLVLGSPVYGNAAARPLTHYLERLGDLGGRPVALVFTAAGDAGPALQASAGQAQAQHGRVVGRYGYTTQTPNGPSQGHAGSNVERAIAMARDAGAKLRPGAP
ncbi:MAG: hypothetical protein KF891_22610 [Rhizobacter sp.]|nr:hypothetical protein [Rhizobacter sp.]